MAGRKKKKGIPAPGQALKDAGDEAASRGAAEANYERYKKELAPYPDIKPSAGMTFQYGDTFFDPQNPDDLAKLVDLRDKLPMLAQVSETPGWGPKEMAELQHTYKEMGKNLLGAPIEVGDAGYARLPDLKGTIGVPQGYEETRALYPGGVDLADSSRRAALDQFLKMLHMEQRQRQKRHPSESVRRRRRRR